MDRNRYIRQTALPEIGPEGQARLGRARMAVVGCGALGSVMAEMAARMGIGSIDLIDRDVVDVTNLSRQSLFTEADAGKGRPKAVAAQERLAEINSGITINAHARDVDWRSVDDLLASQDLILDGTDNFETRFLINEYCVKNNMPWVYGGALATRGMAALFKTPETPCFRCMLNTLPDPGDTPTCETAGVMAPIIHWVAGLEISLAVKYLVWGISAVTPELFTLDVWRARVSGYPMSALRASGKCPTCEEGRYPSLEGAAGVRSRALCGRNAVQLSSPRTREIGMAELSITLARLGQVERYPSMLRFHTGHESLVVFDDGRAIVEGTTDIERAKSIYAKYIGT